MNKKLNYNPDFVLNKRFSTELSGYNPLEVDQFFDQVIEDYRTFEDTLRESRDLLEQKNILLQEKEHVIETLKAEILTLKDQLDKTGRATNVELLEQIRKLTEEIMKYKQDTK